MRIECCRSPAEVRSRWRRRTHLTDGFKSPTVSSIFSMLSLYTATASRWSWVVPLVLVLLALRRRRKNARYPPGPHPLPIVGNILDLPRRHLGREFSALSKQFGRFFYQTCASLMFAKVLPWHVLPGDVIHLSVVGRDVVVLGSLKAARDLLGKRSANYCDRPTWVMVQGPGTTEIGRAHV